MLALAAPQPQIRWADSFCFFQCADLDPRAARWSIAPCEGSTLIATFFYTLRPRAELPPIRRRSPIVEWQRQSHSHIAAQKRRLGARYLQLQQQAQAVLERGDALSRCNL